MRIIQSYIEPTSSSEVILIKSRVDDDEAIFRLRAMLKDWFQSLREPFMRLGAPNFPFESVLQASHKARSAKLSDV